MEQALAGLNFQVQQSTSGEAPRPLAYYHTPSTGLDPGGRKVANAMIEAERLNNTPAVGHDAMGAKIYVVVPVYNRKGYLERFLHCMRRQIFKNFEIIVVDDGSTDGTSELIIEQFPEVKLLRGDGNLWWTGATNVGIRYAMTQASATDAVLVINDDLEVNPDYLEILHSLFKSMPRTLIGSVIVNIKNPDVIDNGGVVVNMLTAKFTVLNRKKQLSEFGKNHYVEVSLLSGRGTLIPIQVFYEIGLFDEKHFQQGGDIELPVRARNSGYLLITSYGAIVKSYIESTDSINISEYYSLKDFKMYFFGIKSSFRLKERFFFSLNMAKNPFYLFSYFLSDLLRITCHFILRLRFRKVVKRV
jgi:GT2 family glycosyltransferase